MKHLFTRAHGPRFRVPNQAIEFTEQVLKQYGSIDDGHEGFVYWCGRRSGASRSVELVIAPRLDSRFAGVQISSASNADFVATLSDHSMVEIAQVHSHPGDWVEHSCGDDRLTPFKVDGLLSIVVRRFGAEGILPLTRCGIHLFQGNRFHRCSDAWVRSHVALGRGRATFRDLR